MNVTANNLKPDCLRQAIIGVDAPFCTPFGQRLMTYCDYTASGRTLTFIEKYLMKLQRHYANTHTEDDMTGRSMTRLLHDAEQRIKDSLGATEQDRIICTGTGATGAITKIQQILGTYLPPATRAQIERSAACDLDKILAQSPVVFVGPYEHHSNEISWRDGLCEVVELDLDAQGHADLDQLTELLQQDQYQNRLKIGSFSAASNVTGLISHTRKIARLLHQHDALAFFDFAASAPYVEIDMHPKDDPLGYYDAVFLSPHKFLGGPGSTGVLVFNKDIYQAALKPTVSGGGTVSYVARHDHDFFDDIEEREKAGTPGVLQIMRAALCFEVKEKFGVQQIHNIEQQWLQQAFSAWQNHPRIEILGDQDPANRVGIVSFNIKTASGKYLHPKFITVLLNDLFGIQSRAGCSCAGPYGHQLLGIDEETSEQYRALIQKGYHGIKPGWCRVGFHYIMDQAEVQYIIDCVNFIADNGAEFLPWYKFCLKQACWQHIHDDGQCPELSLDEAFKQDRDNPQPLAPLLRKSLYQQFLQEAERLKTEAKSLPVRAQQSVPEIEHLNQFIV
ncbi:aminotransferase class V-fold PLP-dependent enzyme [Marinicella meishanensis]|uniref:aminotransferase class V-fold PLP-dependent enzyme n=1 Tax=Marinicella meishanensis TaxID=2873263 RepID=UPI001CC0FAC3|nr:aminotransferase class V-fold PLP-dependent enzyme [Marinicella sp. NBU2979]